MQDFKNSQSKFLNKFPAQPYLGYCRYQLTKYQFFQTYYIIISIVIITVLSLLLLLSSSSSLLLLLFLLKSWSFVVLSCFRLHQLAFKPSNNEVLLLTCGRVLPTDFCLQPFFHKDSVSLLFAQFYLYIQVSSQLINVFLTLFLTAEAQLVHHLSGAAAIYLRSKSFFRSFEKQVDQESQVEEIEFHSSIQD